MYGSSKFGDKLWGTVWERGAGICGEEEVGGMWQNYNGQGKNVTEEWKDKKNERMGRIRQEKQWGRHITARKECKIC